MSDRSSNSSSYRYGFGGQEKGDEVAGEGNSYTAEFWQYDPRLGRRWNRDPKPNPSISEYATFANNPIWNSDFKGDTIAVTTDLEKSKGGMASFNEWKSSEAGQAFFKDYDIGGKFEEVSVVFGLEDSDSDGKGGTSAYAVDRKTGIVTASLYSERDIELYTKQGYNMSNSRSTLSSNEYLKFKVGFPATGIQKNEIIERRWNIRNGLTILHETQHIRLYHNDLIISKLVWYTHAEQHWFMKDKNDKWYKGRFNYYRSKYPEYSDQKIDKIINSFEY